MDDLDEDEGLASANEKISSKPSRSHLKKHTLEQRKKSDITDESWLKELRKRPVRPVTGTERFSNKHRHRLA